jgi:hypothetical protein
MKKRPANLQARPRFSITVNLVYLKDTDRFTCWLSAAATARFWVTHVAYAVAIGI